MLAGWSEVIEDAADRRREAARRPTPCGAPEMCSTCWDYGGHNRRTGSVTVYPIPHAERMQAAGWEV